MQACPLVTKTCPLVEPVCPLVEPVCPLPQPVCPLVDNSCARGHCIVEDYDDCDECCDVEPVCDVCLAHQYDFAETMGLDAPIRGGRRGGGDMLVGRGGAGIFRGGRGGGLFGGGGRRGPGLFGGGRRGGAGLLPALVGGAARAVLSPLIGGPGFYPYYGYGGLRRPGGSFFFPGSFASLGLRRRRWWNPYNRLYAHWYPPRAVPIVIYGNGSEYINPDLANLGEYPDIPLPTFDLPLNFRELANRDDLTPEEQALVSNTLQRIDVLYRQLLRNLARNQRYQYWTSRGFSVVPDLSQMGTGRFVWVYSATLPNTTIGELMSEVKLSCPACGGINAELKELYKLTHESILFDVRGKEGDDIFKGFFISKEGHVYAYHITHDHENPSAEKTTVVELIPDKQVPAMEIERLVQLLTQLSESQVDHDRRHTGPIHYDGFINFKRIHIYGDDDSKSPIADELVSSINAIIS